MSQTHGKRGHGLPTPPWRGRSDHCADCGELVTQTEALQGLRCYKCSGPLHVECVMTDDAGNAACEPCFVAENTRFTLVMSRGAGEGREPITDAEDPKDRAEYDKPLSTSVERFAWFAALEVLKPGETIEDAARILAEESERKEDE